MIRCFYCYYSVNKRMICFIKKYEHRFMGSVKTRAAKIERALCIWLEDEVQVGLSVIDAVVRRAACMPVKGD